MCRRSNFFTGLAVLLSCITTARAQVAVPTGDAINGKRVYMAVGCNLCHGTIGQGGRPSGPHIAPNPLPYEAFAALVRRPINTMPAYTKAVLPDRDLADIHAFLATIAPNGNPNVVNIFDK